MSCDWDFPGSKTETKFDDEPAAFDEPVGRSFGKGRGFVPRGVNNNSSNNWGSGGGGGGNNWDSSNGTGGDSWGSGGNGGSGFGAGGGFNGERRGGRDGRGFRGGRGGRGGRDEGGFGGGRYSDRKNNDREEDNGGGWSGNRRRNNDDDNGGGWSGKRNDEDGSSNNRYDDDFGGDRERGGGRGRGRDRGDRGDDEDRRNRNDNGDENERPPIYVPKEKTEEELFDDAGITKGINFDDYKDIEVKVSGDNIPPKINSFAEAQLRSLLMDNLRRCKYDDPTPVQKHAIPIILSGRDLMATAQTGSGKTAAFLLPIIHYLLEHPEEANRGGGKCEPNALILTPTRELCIQIFEVAKKFTLSSYLKVNRIYGGTAMGYQSNQLSSGCNILVATPGRLGDFVNRGYLGYSSIKFVVLDEADRMLDMGFRVEIDKLFANEEMPKRGNRQTLMFSATFDQDVQRLASNYLEDHLFLAVGVVGGACKDVEQNFIQVSRNDKKRKLKEILDDQADVKGTLVFVETKRNADFVASYLSGTDYPTTSIHGDRFQQQREEALRDFKSRRMHILVATSVAARGLDIRGVSHVINYDIPKSIDEYVHRIGRTGRLGNKGKATSFYDSSVDSAIATDLVKVLKQANQPVPPFLEQDATGISGYSDNTFGGHDYRSNDNVGTFRTDSSNQPEQIPSEEVW